MSKVFYTNNEGRGNLKSCLSQTFEMMGTHIDVQLVDENAVEKMNQVHELLLRYNLRFSANQADSELNQVNDHAGIGFISVHPELFELIKIGKQESLAKPSLLDIAIGPITQAWHIGFSDAKQPSDALLLDLLELCHPQDILLNAFDSSVFLSKKGMKIDLGALAKGYIADRIFDLVKPECGLINLGGNVLVCGNHPQHSDGFWVIGIQDPKLPRGNHVGILKIKDASVVTSGIYERTFEFNGKVFHHLFSAQTGYPIHSEMASLTIVSKTSLTCEIWTSRLFGLDVGDALREINQQKTIEGIIITQSGQVYCSDRLKANFEIL